MKSMHLEAEEQIKCLLAEKELLLVEVHHRIKNNLNTMMSLLLLQPKAQKEPAVAAILPAAMNRLQSMEVLYDKLYKIEDFSEIWVKDYLLPLIDEIIHVFPHRETVKIETEISDFTLSTRVLSSLGIIVNELITNMMKYAFTGRNEGTIKASASLKESHVTLVFEDNGIGIPEAVDFGKSTGFGLSLVGILTKQLRGTIRLERQEGTRFILEFEVTQL